MGNEDNKNYPNQRVPMQDCRIKVSKDGKSMVVEHIQRHVFPINYPWTILKNHFEAKNPSTATEMSEKDKAKGS